MTSKAPELTDEIVERAAIQCGNDLIILASKKNKTVQELFDGFYDKLKRVEARRIKLQKMGNEPSPELEDKIIKEAANDFANELVVIASNANMTVQEIFDGLSKKLKNPEEWDQNNLVE
jgi:hypothetical protein